MLSLEKRVSRPQTFMVQSQTSGGREFPRTLPRLTSRSTPVVTTRKEPNINIVRSETEAEVYVYRRHIDTDTRERRKVYLLLLI